MKILAFIISLAPNKFLLRQDSITKVIMLARMNSQGVANLLAKINIVEFLTTTLDQKKGHFHIFPCLFGILVLGGEAGERGSKGSDKEDNFFGFCDISLRKRRKKRENCLYKGRRIFFGNVMRASLDYIFLDMFKEFFCHFSCWSTMIAKFSTKD